MFKSMIYLLRIFESNLRFSPSNSLKMKNIIKTSLLSLTFLASCVSTKVSSKNNYDYSILKPNTKYIIETKDGNKIRAFELTKVTENSLVGSQENKEMNIDKSNINKVSKFSAGKTIPLVIVGVGVAILAPAYAKNKPVGQ